MAGATSMVAELAPPATLSAAAAYLEMFAPEVAARLSRVLDAARPGGLLGGDG